jgi:hypothetical protein
LRVNAKIVATVCCDRDRRCPAYAAGGTLDDHVPADQRTGRIVAPGPVRIKVFGAVLPQHRGVACKVRYG